LRVNLFNNLRKYSMLGKENLFEVPLELIPTNKTRQVRKPGGNRRVGKGGGCTLTLA
jgi:hypothetical protein